jgi:hypothetical protein
MLTRDSFGLTNEQVEEFLEFVEDDDVYAQMSFFIRDNFYKSWDLLSTNKRLYSCDIAKEICRVLKVELGACPKVEKKEKKKKKK